MGINCTENFKTSHGSFQVIGVMTKKEARQHCDNIDMMLPPINDNQLLNETSQYLMQCSKALQYKLQMNTNSQWHVGLFRDNDTWNWSDGQIYNGTLHDHLFKLYPPREMDQQSVFLIPQKTQLMSTLTIEGNKHPTMCYLEDVVSTTAESTTAEVTTVGINTGGGGLFFALLAALFCLWLLIVLCCVCRKCKRILRRRRRRKASKKESKNKKSKVLKRRKPKVESEKQEEHDKITSISFFDEMEVLDEIDGILKSNGKKKANGSANKVSVDASFRSIPDTEIPLKV